MRWLALVVCLLSSPAVLPAQSGGEDRRWLLGIGGDAIRFSSAARATSAEQGVAATLRPTGRLGLHLSLARMLGTWEVALETSWAGGHVEAGNDAITVQDRGSDMSRYRLAPSVGRRVAQVGSGSLGLVVSPTFDLWMVSGENRGRVGVEARLSLRLALGKAELENRVTVGLSGNPVTRADVGDDFELGGLRTLAFGAGLRIGL
jgi:hypothetical protein